MGKYDAQRAAHKLLLKHLQSQNRLRSRNLSESQDGTSRALIRLTSTSITRDSRRALAPTYTELPNRSENS